MPTTDELLTATEVAQRLRVSRRQVEEMSRRKVIPCVWLGPHLRRYVLADVMQAIQGAQKSKK